MIDDVNLIENEEGIQDEGTIEVIAVDEIEPIVISASEAFPALGEDNDEMNHAKLYGRDFPDQHPISAITGLREKIDEIESLKTVYSDKKLQADYYKWSDANPRRENRGGLFVSICPETTDIQICNNEQDVFGVTVAEAGFIGGQEYIKTVDNVKVGRDRTYGLVAHSGLVSVRRETTVKVGDYVVPNVRGEAKRVQKTDDTNYYYGYLVVGLSEVDGIQYAIILLGAPSALSQKIADCVDNLYGRMNVAEYNITSVINVVNTAYELARDAKENSNSNAEYVAGQMGAMSDKLEAADQLMQNIGVSVQGACESAAMARVIASNAVNEAEAMRSEVAASTQEVLTEMSKTRQEVDQKILDINIELDHIGLNLQATNESINATKNGMQDSIDDIVYNLEKLGQDLTPLTAWPNETNPSGIAGFVAQSNADSATLASITKFEGEFGESIAGFVQEATKDNATVSAIASYQQKDADGNPYGPSGASVLMSQVDANTASINLLTELEGDGFTGLAGLTAKVDENSSSISTLASHVIGEFENTDDWTEEGKDTAKVYYAKNSRLYYYYSPIDGIWYSTSKAYEANLSGAISGVQSVVDAKSSEIDALAIWQTGAAESIASIEQKADQNASDISLLASWKSGVESDVSSIATIKSTADTNKASIEELVKKDTELSTVVAGVKTTADANQASIESITSWQSTVNPTINSVASIEQKVIDNAAEIESLTSWQGTTNMAMANLQQQADDNGAKIEACVANIAKYAVGEHSQAYGLLRNQAKEILTSDMVYVPTIMCNEMYGGDAPYTQEFIKGYYYTWNTTQLKWDVSLVPGVNFSSAYIIGTTTTPYWVVTVADVEQDGTLYDLGGLYLWKDGSWTKVAAMADNTLSRAVSKIKQTANEVEAGVASVKGDVAGLDIRVGNNETSLQTVTSWKSTVEDDVSKIATIEQKANDASTSVSLVVSEKNGEKVVNTASIVASINDGDSDVLLEANRIKLAGDVTIASWCDPKDQTKIHGSNIETNTIDAYSISTTNLKAMLTEADILSADNIIVTGSETLKTALDKVNEDLDSLEIGATNLAAGKYISGYTSTDNYVYTLQTTSANNGMKISNEVFKPGQSYVVSYKFKVVDGDTHRISGHCRNFIINKIVLDGVKYTGAIYPSTGDTNIAVYQSPGLEFDTSKSNHSIAIYLTRRDSDYSTNTSNLDLYIQPQRNPNNDEQYESTTEIWDLQVTEGTVAIAWSAPIEEGSTSLVSHQYVTTDTMKTPGGDAVWNDSFPEDWKGRSIVWKRTKTTDSTGRVTYGEPAMLSSADAARMASELAGYESVGEWCKENNVTVIDGSNLMTGTIDASQIDVTNINATNIKSGKLEATLIKADTLEAITGNMGTLDTGCIQSKNYSGGDGELIIQDNEPTPSSGLALTLSDDGTYYIVSGIGTCTDTKIVIPHRQGGYEVKEIAVQAFRNCTNITEVYVPHSVVRIGNMAFSGCSALTSITLPFVGTSKQLDNTPSTAQSFGYIFGTASYTGSTKVTQTYNFNTNKTYTWYLPTSLKTIRITGGDIGHAAFHGLPFSGRTLILDYGVKSIGDYAFYKCRLLGNVHLPNSITHIGMYAFYEWSNYLTSPLELIIPDSVQSIGAYAFYNCTNLTSVTVGGSVEYMGMAAFANCAKMSQLTLKEGIRDLGDVVDGATFRNCTSLTTLEIPASVTRIGLWAFDGCTGLQSIYMTINSSLESIGYEAFHGCSNLTTVYLGSNVTFIDDAFRMSGLTTVYYYGAQADRYNITMNDSIGYLVKANWYYYDDEDRQDAHSALWRRNPVSGFRISCQDDNLIDSRYFKVSQDGKMTAQNATVRGSIMADSGQIGGLLLTANTLQSNNFQLSTIKVGDNSESIMAFYDGDNVATSIDSQVVSAGQIEAQQIMHTPALYTDSLALNNGLKIAYSRITYGDRYLEFGDSDNTKSYTATLTSVSAGTQFKITITPEPLIYDKTFSIACYCRSGKTRYGTITIASNNTEGFFSIPLGWIVEYATINEEGSLGNTYTFTQATASELVKISGSILPVQDNIYDLGGPSPNRWKTVYAATGTINTSDINEKNTVEPLSAKYDVLFDALQGVSYKFNENTSDRNHIGFIAQDVENALISADLTTKEFAGICKWKKEDDTYGYGLRYSEFIALNTDQIQKLKKRVVELENIVKVLTTKQND